VATLGLNNDHTILTKKLENIIFNSETQKSKYNESTMQLYEDQLKKLNKSLFEEKQTVVELNSKLETYVYEKDSKISFYEHNEEMLKLNINQIHDNYNKKINDIHNEYEKDNIQLNKK
jgi:hypothetical protein